VQTQTFLMFNSSIFSGVFNVGEGSVGVFNSAIFNNAVFNTGEESVAEQPAPSGGGSYRYFTPLPANKKKIDRAIKREAKINAQIVEYQEKGVDVEILQDLMEKLYEIQKTLLRLALESREAHDYIAQKREEEDIAVILMILGR
jgi:hypothetical protein